MAIKTNKELSQAIDKAITDSGYTRGYISDQLSIYKQNISIDDANKILKLVDCEAEITIKKVLKNQ